MRRLSLSTKRALAGVCYGCTIVRNPYVNETLACQDPPNCGSAPSIALGPYHVSSRSKPRWPDHDRGSPTQVLWRRVLAPARRMCDTIATIPDPRFQTTRNRAAHRNEPSVMSIGDCAASPRCRPWNDALGGRPAFSVCAADQILDWRAQLLAHPHTRASELIVDV